jgi:hypothetical protein
MVQHAFIVTEACRRPLLGCRPDRGALRVVRLGGYKNTLLGDDPKLAVLASPA